MSLSGATVNNGVLQAAIPNEYVPETAQTVAAIIVAGGKYYSGFLSVNGTAIVARYYTPGVSTSGAGFTGMIFAQVVWLDM